MSRRIEIELTSARPDGTWTWRAAGAREPKGVLNGSLLPEGSKVGDVVRADAEFDVEGIEVVAVLAPKGSRKEPERLELLGRGDFEPVVQTLAPRRDRPRREGDRPDRPPRGPRPDGDRRGPRPEGDRRGPRPDGDRRGPRPEGQRPRRDQPEGGSRPPRGPRPERPPVPELPQRPKPKRLRPGRAHRSAVLAELPEEHKPIAEQLLRGGIPAVRQALQEQNTRLKAEGLPEIKPQGVLSLAEQLLPRLRVAEWLDRAEAAKADLSELDLRDLRSVVAASEDPAVARDERTTELTKELREGLMAKQEAELQEWFTDIDAALGVGRSVRALRLSSRPPKAGVRFPAELGTRLADATAATLTAEASTERWVAVLDALAYSPVRTQVHPAGIPSTVSDELRAAVTRVAGLLPDIARQFGIEPPPPGSRPPRPPRPGGPAKPNRKPGGRAPVPPPPPASTPAPAPAEASAPATTAEPDAPATEASAPAAAPDATEESAPAATAEPDAAEAPPAALDAAAPPPAALDPGAAPPVALEAAEAPPAAIEAPEAPAGALEAGAHAAGAIESGEPADPDHGESREP
jgi:hypothetical protein